MIYKIRSTMQVFGIVSILVILSGCGMFKNQNDCGCFSKNKEVKQAPVHATSPNQKSPVLKD
jgi:hypothetical protein